MIKHDYNEQESIWMRLELHKLGFLPRLQNLETSSCRDVSDKTRQRRDVQVPTLQNGAFEPSHIPT